MDLVRSAQTAVLENSIKPLGTWGLQAGGGFGVPVSVCVLAFSKISGLLSWLTVLCRQGFGENSKAHSFVALTQLGKLTAEWM